MNSNPNLYHIALSFIPSIGSIHAKQLISYCGSAEAVFKQRKAQLLKIPGIGEKTVNAIIKNNALDFAAKEIKFIEKNKIEVLIYSDKNYPKRLSHCQDAPLLLYKKGKTNLNAKKVISIVGTRKATHYGKEFVKQLLADLKSINIQVVSGMALGIDGQAHKSSLENNIETIGILGHGLNNLYPASHKNLAQEIIQRNGSMLTECNSQEKMIPANFPKRNRIIAGMSDAVIVVESDIKGGSIISAQLANSYNRDVFALPGRYKDKYSSGCNFLIKAHKAQIIESAKDLIYVMGWQQTEKPIRKIQRELLLDLSENEQTVIDILKTIDSIETDDLALQTKLTSSTLAGTLLELELKGIIHSLPGNSYSLS